MSQGLKDTDKEMMGCMTYKGSSCYKKNQWHKQIQLFECIDTREIFTIGNYECCSPDSKSAW